MLIHLHYNSVKYTNTNSHTCSNAMIYVAMMNSRMSLEGSRRCSKCHSFVIFRKQNEMNAAYILYANNGKHPYQHFVRLWASRPSASHTRTHIYVQVHRTLIHSPMLWKEISKKFCQIVLKVREIYQELRWIWCKPINHSLICIVFLFPVVVKVYVTSTRRRWRWPAENPFVASMYSLGTGPARRTYISFP